MSKTGCLYLIPVPICDENPLAMVPQGNLEICRKLIYFVGEDEKITRRNLKLFDYANIQDAQISVLNEHNRHLNHSNLLQPLLEGNDVGLMSDAGCPGIADPGAELVRLAHAKNIRVVPLTGPSSIVLSIMASGFTGQNFAFNGYLPVDKTARQKRIKELEQISRKQGQAQFFIETPYRNEQFMQALLENLGADTKVFVGVNIAAPSQSLITRTVADWRKTKLVPLHKIPAVFGIYAGA